MCLIKNKKHHPFNRPLITKEDIFCYKVLSSNYFSNGCITPCTHSEVPIECLKKEVPFKAKILHKFKFIWRHILGFSNVVEDGFIHTYSLTTPYIDLLYSDHVFKCIIPKGTKYFIGDDKDYASEQIIFVEQLK